MNAQKVIILLLILSAQFVRYNAQAVIIISVLLVNLDIHLIAQIQTAYSVKDIYKAASYAQIIQHVMIVLKDITYPVAYVLIVREIF